MILKLNKCKNILMLKLKKKYFKKFIFRCIRAKLVINLDGFVKTKI